VLARRHPVGATSTCGAADVVVAVVLRA